MDAELSAVPRISPFEHAPQSIVLLLAAAASTCGLCRNSSPWSPVFSYMVNRSTRMTLFSQGILFLYYQVIEWVNLFPWNDIRRGNGQASLDLIMGGSYGRLDTRNLAAVSLGDGYWSWIV